VKVFSAIATSFGLTVLFLTVPAAQDAKGAAEQYVGVYSGTWEGAGTGGFELTLEKPKDGAIAGRVSVTGEPTYKATFRTVSFEANVMHAAYDFPPDGEAEILLNARFEGKTVTGTWVARVKATGMDVASGTWTCTKP
jgi:hypothetical protein